MSSVGLQLNFLNRVATLPIVNSAIGFATDTYSRVKNSNGLINATLTSAEQSFYFLANTAKPVLDKFEKPISAADSFACQNFDYFQKKVTVTNKTPEDIRVEGKRLFDLSVAQFQGIRLYGNAKIGEIRDYGLNKVNNALESSYVKALVRSVDTAIYLTENAVDH